MTRHVVVGAGIAGLTAALHLPRDSTVVLEAGATPGGICRTNRKDGFLFDRAGHFLHLRDPRTKALVNRLLAGQLAPHARRAAIHVAGNYVPHPFQGHLGWLPLELRRECVIGYVEALAHQTRESPADAANLLEWFRRSFGVGMTRHFLEPQNRKAYCCDLTELESDWVADFVPQPSIDQVIDGAFAKDASSNVGYNAELLYPLEGGIEILPRAMAAQLDSVLLGRCVVAIDAGSRRVSCSTGESWSFDNLISTMPLRELVAMTAGLPTAIKAAATRLRSVDVLDIQLGVAGSAQVPYHWVYFPEEKFPFVRVVNTSNICPAMAPKGYSTLQVEVNCRSGTSLDIDWLTTESISVLEGLGILSKGRVVSASVDRIACAYVVHDHFRKKALPEILRVLRDQGIYSVGRFGGWGYGGMEAAMIDGIDVANACSPAAVMPV